MSRPRKLDRSRWEPERRKPTSYGTTPRANGRTTVELVCPWCGEHVDASLWSLTGTGKRCTCGVLFTSFDAVDDCNVHGGATPRGD